MNNKTLRKDEALTLLIGHHLTLPNGEVKIVESGVNVTYDQILHGVFGKRKGTRPSKSPGTKFSRIVGLNYVAATTGKWATGAAITSTRAITSIKNEFDKLDRKYYVDVTVSARTKLKELGLTELLEKISNEKIN